MTLPNAHGVYEPSERLELSNPAKGWRGCPLAEIDVVKLDDGWRWATGSCLPGGSGHATPLTRYRDPLPTRDAAVEAAAAHLRRRMAGDTCSAARAVIEWLDNLRPAQPDLFADLAA